MPMKIDVVQQGIHDPFDFAPPKRPGAYSQVIAEAYWKELERKASRLGLQCRVPKPSCFARGQWLHRDEHFVAFHEGINSCASYSSIRFRLNSCIDCDLWGRAPCTRAQSSFQFVSSHQQVGREL